VCDLPITGTIKYDGSGRGRPYVGAWDVLCRRTIRAQLGERRGSAERSGDHLIATRTYWLTVVTVPAHCSVLAAAVGDRTASESMHAATVHHSPWRHTPVATA